MTNDPASRGATETARLIDKKLDSLGDWRADMLQRLRTVVTRVDPAIIEEVKWIKPTNPYGVIAWSLNGLICTGETYKRVVKLTFYQGASLPDPTGLFNAGFNGRVRRAIDVHEHDEVDEEALQELVRAAIARNRSKRK